jgi:hypothetical protein
MSNDQQTQPDPAPATTTEAPGKDVKYAVYDETYLRYRGDVHDTKAKATKAAKDAKVKDYRIDEV